MLGINVLCNVDIKKTLYATQQHLCLSSSRGYNILTTLHAREKYNTNREKGKKRKYGKKRENFP